jgi:hypothetical protein
MGRAEQKFTAGNEPERSFLASSPFGTHGHRSVQCQGLCVFSPSLFLPLVKGGVGLLFIYRLVFTYHTLFHLRLHSLSSPQGLSKNIHISHTTHKIQPINSQLLLVSPYVASGLTSQKTRSMSMNECALLLRIC